MKDPTRRFTGRVEDYLRYRPQYPNQLIGLLEEECGLTEQSVVADIGSGTGFLAHLFAKNGNRVFGVEPNRAMREAGEWYLRGYPTFQSIDCSAEATGLTDHSVDFIVSGQAFHWFDPGKTRDEFVRILRPEGWVVLVWNVRRVDSDPFGAAYENLLLTHARDYEESCHRRVDDDVLRAFFSPGEYSSRTFPNRQTFDFEGLKGRLLSASYTPQAGDPGYGLMLEGLRKIFKRHQEEGKVTFRYDTRVHYGQLPAHHGRLQD